MTFLECRINQVFARKKNNSQDQEDLDKDQKARSERNRGTLKTQQLKLRENKIFTQTFTQLFKLKY